MFNPNTLEPNRYARASANFIADEYMASVRNLANAMKEVEAAARMFTNLPSPFVGMDVEELVQSLRLDYQFETPDALRQAVYDVALRDALQGVG